MKGTLWRCSGFGTLLMLSLTTAICGCQRAGQQGISGDDDKIASHAAGLRTSQTIRASTQPSQLLTTSVLQFHPGGGVAPSPQILVSTFGYEDVTAASADGQYNYDQQSSFQQTVSQGSEAIKAHLRDDFSVAYPPNLTPNHPACASPVNPNLVIYSYVKPYTYDQANVLGWIHAYSPISDFMPPLARKTNSYLGAQDCPWGASSANIARTFGYAAYATPQKIQLYIDNELNPWRWNGPMNSIHPVEQPSFAAISNVQDSTVFDQTESILQNFRTGADRSTHILLDYSVDFTVADQRTALGENSLWDIYGGVAPESGTTLPAITHWFTYIFGQVDGVYNYAVHRLITPSVQLSLMVNFRADQQAWIENEFMLSSFNYETTVPSATANPTINQYIFEGGTNPNVSWYRLRADALSLPGLLANSPANPIVVSGGGYAPITFQNNQFHTVLWGTIDLTNYYLVSHGNQFFPGQTANIDGIYGEKNGINWAGVIVENHGPFAVSAQVNTFNIRTMSTND